MPNKNFVLSHPGITRFKNGKNHKNNSIFMQ
jgi:hypothetical protein